MSSFKNAIAEDRRLVLLRLLSEVPSYESNSSVLQMGLDAFGHAVSRDVIDGDIAWLTEMGLVTSTKVATVFVVTLTGRGQDVANGRAQVPGVKKPGPR